MKVCSIVRSAYYGLNTWNRIGRIPSVSVTNRVSTGTMLSTVSRLFGIVRSRMAKEHYK